MINKLLGSIGLVINLMGISILFIFGFPQPDFDESVGLGLEDGNRLANGLTVKEYGEQIVRKKKTYQVLSLFSLFLIILGVILQMVSLWI